jgi:hypothetical protein
MHKCAFESLRGGGGGGGWGGTTETGKHLQGQAIKSKVGAEDSERWPHRQLQHGSSELCHLWVSWQGIQPPRRKEPEAFLPKTPLA